MNVLLCASGLNCWEIPGTAAEVLLRFLSLFPYQGPLCYCWFLFACFLFIFVVCFSSFNFCWMPHCLPRTLLDMCGNMHKVAKIIFLWIIFKQVRLACSVKSEWLGVTMLEMVVGSTVKARSRLVTPLVSSLIFSSAFMVNTALARRVAAWWHRSRQHSAGSYWVTQRGDIPTHGRCTGAAPRPDGHNTSSYRLCGSIPLRQPRAADT